MRVRNDTGNSESRMLAEKVNALDRRFDGEEINECRVINSVLQQRRLKFRKDHIDRMDWIDTDVEGGSGLPDPGTEGQVLTLNASLDAIWDDATDAFPWAQLAFGYSIAALVVTIYEGYVVHAKRSVITIGGTNFTISDATTWIAVRYTIGAGAASLVSSATRPLNGDVYAYWPLYRFTKTGSVVTLAKIYHLGEVQIPSIYA